ncbi:MAG TPA: M61 family peptidase, partial [Candidatus Angelobacter sp.]|nr:M61 family peptidase [Candidatus Angelobacter sp.]
MIRSLKKIVSLILLLTALPGLAQKHKRSAASAPATPSQPIKLMVDATQAPQKILHAQEEIPVAPGPVTLVYPKWIPGEHGPTGPITDFTGLEFFAGGKRLTWRRDLVEMYAFHVDVPQGVNTVEAKFDLAMPAPPEGFSSGASATTQLLVLSWNQVVLYWQGAKSDDVTVQAEVKLPAGWHFGTALQPQNESLASNTSGEISFKPVSLTMLVDSPVLSGAHFRRIQLSPGPIEHYIDIAADSEA